MKKRKNLTKLYLMIITLPKGKKEIIGDLLERFDVTGYLSTLASGSLEKSFQKEVMMCTIKEDKIKEAILALEDKFSHFRQKTSMLYTIPIDSIIGVSSYMALSNGGK